MLIVFNFIQNKIKIRDIFLKERNVLKKFMAVYLHYAKVKQDGHQWKVSWGKFSSSKSPDISLQ